MHNLIEAIGEGEFDRSIDEVSEESTRIGSLIGAQIAICAVLLVDKLIDYCLLPFIALFVLLVLESASYIMVCLSYPVTRRLTPAPDILELRTFTFLNICKNRKAAGVRARLFYTA